MIPGFYSKPTVFIGLAMHAERISMLKLRKIKKEIMIEGFLSFISSKTIKEQDKTNLFIEKIKEFVTHYQARYCDASLALPASQVMQKRIKIPNFLTDQERAFEIGSNLNYYLPGLSEPLHIDFIELDKNENDVELQLIAARSAQIESYLKLTQSAGLKVKWIDLDAYAISRAICWIEPTYFKKTIVLLDMEPTQAQLILLSNGKIISIFPLLLEKEDKLVQEIKRGLQFFLSEEHAISIEKIVLTGYYSDPDSFHSFLDAYFSIPIERVNAFQHCLLHPDLKPEKINILCSRLLVALGLALRGVMNG